MTDATVQQQGESKRRREHLEVPQAADSSNSSESSTDTEMGLVDVCTILCENSGPVTLDLTEWDFSKADCRNKCRKLVENSIPQYKCTEVGISFTHIHIPPTVGTSLQWWIS